MSKNISDFSLTSDDILEINETLFFLLSLLFTKAAAVLELPGGSLPGGWAEANFQIALGNFSAFHHGPAKKPPTHPRCWTWPQPP